MLGRSTRNLVYNCFDLRQIDGHSKKRLQYFQLFKSQSLKLIYFFNVKIDRTPFNYIALQKLLIKSNTPDENLTR